MARTIYEIINPSDHYTLIAGDHEVASLACFVLGQGKYALEPVEGDLPEVPLFLLGGAVEWFAQTFGRQVEEALNARRADLADCLDTVLIGNRADYEAAIAMSDDPAKREQFRADWHDRHRSSMNDIGGRAQQMAQSLRERQAAE